MYLKLVEVRFSKLHNLLRGTSTLYGSVGEENVRKWMKIGPLDPARGRFHPMHRDTQRVTRSHLRAWLGNTLPIPALGSVIAYAKLADLAFSTSFCLRVLSSW
eukprot:sb/3478281/